MKRPAACLVVVSVFFGCSSSSNSGSSGGAEGGAPTASAAAENLAASSLCSANADPPPGLHTSCATQTTIDVVGEKDQRAYCGTHGFGWFLFSDVMVAGQSDRRLYYCASSSRAEYFPFGEDYASVIVVKDDTGISGFALAATAHGYRCYSTKGPGGNLQVINNQKPLPIGEELCGGFAVVQRDTVAKVTLQGHTLQMVSIVAGAASMPATTPCDDLQKRCCPIESNRLPEPERADALASCTSLAGQFAAENNQTACQNRITAFCSDQ